jgi:hypothetical protein
VVVGGGADFRADFGEGEIAEGGVHEGACGAQAVGVVERLDVVDAAEQPRCFVFEPRDACGGFHEQCRSTLALDARGVQSFDELQFRFYLRYHHRHNLELM